ncbi:hypothetical protein [Fictibacillus norfolkensis]|uniref:Uncharacterized protein n=1 Tax=Fictibacillus norfolkensis TaxID=2762233 RepID=A0ABR8SRN8_9BACL|nr:hypothetical protein [Fictibacillus norfolkensis]MBD7966173.1 hypothetical protein [Fictibacillus norfolkensis]
MKSGVIWLGMMVVRAASVPFDGIFGAFAEEYRVLEDGSGHLLPILRVVRGVSWLKLIFEIYGVGYLRGLFKSECTKLSRNESELSRNEPPLSLKSKIKAVR